MYRTSCRFVAKLFSRARQQNYLMQQPMPFSFIRSMTLVQRVLSATILLSFIILFSPLPRDVNAQVHSGRFDIVYIWNDSLSSLLDYKEAVSYTHLTLPTIYSV